jgi:adenylate cyclase
MARLAKVLKHPALISMAMIAGAFGLTCAAWQTGLLQPVELFVYDHFIRWGAPHSGADPRLIVVGITEEDIQKYDYAITDDVLARLLEEICRHQPAVVGVDLFRDLPVPRDGSQADKLRDVLLSHDNIICSFRLGDEHSAASIPPPPALKELPERCAFIDLPYDNKTIRRALLYAGTGGAVHTSMAMQVALGYLASRGLEVEPDPGNANLVRLGKVTLPRFEQSDGGYVRGDDRGYQVFLDFRGPSAYRTLSLNDILTGRYDPADITGQIVLVGITARSVKDYVVTPLNEQNLGVELHAQVVNQLLRSAMEGAPPLGILPDRWECLILLAWCLVTGLSTYLFRSPWFLTLAVAMVATVIVLSGWLFFKQNTWMPVALPMVGALATAGLVTSYISFFENRERRIIMQLFQRNSAIAETIVQRRDEFMAGGRLIPKELTATILFTDLRGYSSLSETMGPAKLLDWLNQYHTEMARAVNRHRGIVVSYAGDALMAAFGVPLERTTTEAIREDAGNAVDCALAMKTALENLNAGWLGKSQKPLAMRVGIYTGEVVAGCIGSAERLEFATIGDTTNTAARLESLDRSATGATEIEVCRILIGDSTFNLVGSRYQTEDLGEKDLKGKAQLVRVYRVVGTAPPTPTNP